jgi:DNA-binding transcriptional ArsR family regulator
LNPLQTRIDSIEERLARIEKIILEGNYRSGKRNDVERLLIDNIGKIPMQHLVVVSLYLNTKQTKEEISNSLEDWGKNVGRWFQKNHFDGLLKKKIIKKHRENRNERYSLTRKGENVADKIIEQLISGKKLQLQKV